jgi:hypothetical protein
MPERRETMRCFIMLFVIVWVMSLGLAHATQPSTTDQATVIGVVQPAVVKALHHRQGDVESLTDAQDGFTPDGWGECMNHLAGWLDDEGAPTFSAEFVPSGEPLDIRRESGRLSVTIPGILTHQTRNAWGGVSSTAYRAEIDVQVGEDPITIEHLSQRTCGGASLVTSCR